MKRLYRQATPDELVDRPWPLPTTPLTMDRAERARRKAAGEPTTVGEALKQGPATLPSDPVALAAWKAMGERKDRALAARPSAFAPDTLPPVAVTPAKQRLAKSRATLAKVGGRRLEINLSPDAADHLATIRAGHVTDKAAIEAALAAHARQIARRKA